MFARQRLQKRLEPLEIHDEAAWSPAVPMRMSVMKVWRGDGTPPLVHGYWLVIVTVPLVVVMRTGRATRPGIVIGAVIARGCATARARVVVVAGATVTGDVMDAFVAVADGATVAGKLIGRWTPSVPVALPATVAPVVGFVTVGVAGVEMLPTVVIAVPALATGGFAAAVGDGVMAEVTVGVRSPVF